MQAAELRTPTPVERWRGVDVSHETEASLRGLYAELQKRFPRSNVCLRLPLDFARDPIYFRESFARCVPPPSVVGVYMRYVGGGGGVRLW